MQLRWFHPLQSWLVSQSSFWWAQGRSPAVAAAGTHGRFDGRTPLEPQQKDLGQKWLWSPVLHAQRQVSTKNAGYTLEESRFNWDDDWLTPGKKLVMGKMCVGIGHSRKEAVFMPDAPLPLRQATGSAAEAASELCVQLERRCLPWALSSAQLWFRCGIHCAAQNAKMTPVV